MSAGLNIFLAGHKRFASEHATFMLHQISGFVAGTYQDIFEQQEERDYLTEMNDEYIISKTRITQADIDEIRTKKKTGIFIPMKP